MAATAAATNVDRPVVATGAGWEMDVLVTLSGSYVTGGIALDFGPFFSQQGQGVVDYVNLPGVGGYVFEYDKTNKKLLIRQGAGAGAPGAEIAAAALPAALTAAAISGFIRGR
jgi:hypothetical protein